MENENVLGIPKGSVLVTPKRARVMARGGIIVYPPMNEWDIVDFESVRTEGKDSIGPKDFQKRIAAFREGKEVNLAGDGQLCLGISMALMLEGQPILGKLDVARKKFHNYLVPSYNLYEDYLEEQLLKVALRRFSKEFVLRSDEAFSFWEMCETTTFRETAIEYGLSGNLWEENSSGLSLVESPIHGGLNVGDDKGDYPVIHQFTGSCFHNVILTVRGPKKADWRIVDAERSTKGKLYNREVVCGYNTEGYPLSDQAEAFLDACKSGLRRIRLPF